MKVINLNSIKTKREKIIVKNNLDLFLIAYDTFDYDLEVVLENKNSKSNILGLILGNQSKTFNLKIYTRHSAKETFSRVHIKSVLSNKSVLNFEGMIRIEKGAFLSDSFLQNDNLLITSDSIANSSPQLEILADDVKASHGVTIKDVDDIYKFYLMSRGLDEKQSTGLIIKGFVNDLLSNLSKNQIKDLNSQGFNCEFNL